MPMETEVVALVKTSWREDLAWAAGFFDGEGCVYNQRIMGRKNTNIALTISQVDARPLHRFIQVVGARGISVRGPKANNSRGNNCQPIYRVDMVGLTRVQASIAQMWAFLSPVKRAQYRKCLVALTTGIHPRNKTHCKYGHPFDVENTIYHLPKRVLGQNNKPYRECRKCKLEYKARVRERSV